MPARGSYGGYGGGASSSGYGRTRREEELAKATGTDAYDQSGLGSYVNLADMDANEAVTAAEDLAIEENIIDTIDERSDQELQQLAQEGLITEDRVLQLIEENQLSQEEIDEGMEPPYTQEDVDVWFEGVSDQFMSREEIETAIADGSLTEEDVQRLIDDGLLTEEDVQQLIADEVLIDGWIADAVEGFLSEEEIDQLIADGTLTEEEISRLIEEGQFTEEQIQQLIAQEMLSEEAIQKLIAQEMLSEEAIQQLIQQEMLSEEDIQKLIDTGQFSQEQIDGWIADAVECLLTEEEIDQLIADGTLTEEEINQLIADGQYSVVLGSRILGNGALKGGMPLYKYFFNRILTLIQNILMGQKLSEYHTGYRAFSAKVLHDINYEVNSNDFVFDNQILAQIFYKDYEIG